MAAIAQAISSRSNCPTTVYAEQHVCLDFKAVAPGVQRFDYIGKNLVLRCVILSVSGICSFGNECAASCLASRADSRDMPTIALELPRSWGDGPKSTQLVPKCTGIPRPLFGIGSSWAAFAQVSPLSSKMRKAAWQCLGQLSFEWRKKDELDQIPKG